MSVAMVINRRVLSVN